MADAEEYTVNGQPVTKEEYQAFLKQVAAQEAKSNNDFSKLRAAEAITPSAPNNLDQNAQVNRQAATPGDTNFNDPSKTNNSGVNQLGQNPNAAKITPANGSFESRMASFGINFSPYPNPLNEYANYTYHIRWFMTTEREAYNNVDGQNPNSSRLTKTVIAESGVTAGLNIVELRIKASSGGNKEKRNMWCLQELDMLLSEPLNLSLFDKIYYSAQEIGVVNHARCPYFIEVWFNGYNEDGTLAAPNLFYTMYRIAFWEVEASTNTTGTAWNIKFYADNSYGEMNQLAIPQAGLNIPATNLGEFFDGLATKLNTQMPEVNNDGIRRVIYKFEYPNIWKTWNMRPADTDKHVNRAGSMDKDNGAPGTGTVVKVTKGQSIENIVNYAVYSCKEAQDWITGNANGASGGASMSEHGIVGYVSIYSKTRIVGFDPVTRDYIREITYTLWRTESTKSYTDIQSVTQAMLPTTQQAKLNYLVQNQRLVKKYDYIYTGLNTEVINFDIKMNLTWMFVQPSWSQGNSYGEYAQPAVTNQDSQDFRKQKGTLPQDKTPGNAQQLNQIDKALGTPQDVAQKLINALPPGAEAAKNYIANNIADPNSRVIRFDGSSGQLAVSAAQEKDPYLEKYLATVKNYQSQREANLATAFVEDTKLDINAVLFPPLPMVALFDSKPTTQNAQQNTDQRKTPANTDSQNFPSGTGFVGAVMGNIFDVRTEAFNAIEITIRGDPWWLPGSNISLNNTVTQLTNNNNAAAAQTAQNQQKANFLGGDNCFLLEFRVGVVIDEDTGLAVYGPGGADFFNGIYVVDEVENILSHGKFTQILKAHKDVLAQNPIGTQNLQGTNGPGGNQPSVGAAAPPAPPTPPAGPSDNGYGYAFGA